MSKVQYLQVAEEEGDEAIELPTEEDGTLLLTTLIGQFPQATGLKFRNPSSKSLRGIRLVDGRLHAPEGGWGDIVSCFKSSLESSHNLECYYFVEF